MDGKLLRYWFSSFLITFVLVAISLRWLDLPIATANAEISHGIGHLGHYLGAPVLVAGELAVGFLLVAYRLVRGKLPELGKVTAVACAASICVFMLNDVVLKPIFGVLPPYLVLMGASHSFRFFQGNWDSSFPSGHMVLASGFAATFMGQRRWLVLLLAAGLGVAGLLLVLGNWHFLSDIMAGSFTGGTAGILAKAIFEARWQKAPRQHSSKSRIDSLL